MIGRRRREKPDPFPRDWPDEVRATAKAHLAAHRAAHRRIQRQRRRLGPAEAEAIVREEATRCGITRSDREVQDTARVALLPPWWPLLHPRQAREAGWRLAWQQDAES